MVLRKISDTVSPQAICLWWALSLQLEHKYPSTQHSLPSMEPATTHPSSRYGVMEAPRASSWKGLPLPRLLQTSPSATAKAVGCHKAPSLWTLAMSFPGRHLRCRSVSAMSVAPCSKSPKVSPLMACSVWMILPICTSHKRSLSMSVPMGQSYSPLTLRLQTIRIRFTPIVGL